MVRWHQVGVSFISDVNWPSTFHSAPPRTEAEVRSLNEETGRANIESNKREIKNQMEQIGGADNGAFDLRQTMEHE